MKITYYTFQHRKTHESPWLKKTPIEPIYPLPGWTTSSWDYFGKVINPLNEKGDGYMFIGTEECHKVWNATSCNGFFTLSHAKEALSRLHKASLDGEFDSRGSYGEHNQVCRYDFRIIKVTHVKDTVEPVE